MKRINFLLLIAILSFFNCSKDEPAEAKTLYFPPVNSNAWETLFIANVGWNTSAEQPLYDFLEANPTDAFIILKDGKIVIEKYFGSFEQSTIHSWNSAAKTLTAFTVGIAQEEGFLSIDNPSSDYMGTGWSSLTLEQESKITVRNHLTMTTGLDYTVPQNFCTDPECFQYKNEPNTYWYYHQGAYTVLDNVVTGAVQQDFKTYFNAKIRDKIGMTGSWVKTSDLNLYLSNARSMARFGLLTLNQGVWDNTTILADKDYFVEMTTTSQDLNKSYGYLYWLNGKSNFKVPGSETLFTGKLIPNAPDDLIAGLGAFDQKLHIVPSKGLVIVRMGDSAEQDELGPTEFDNNLWEKINALID
ncbi:MAG: beta-lactamase family protein [Flavobacteriales bacterium]|nr:beta-lactamase family protein [Flavobacteriia bacterium]NCP06088.1 beta-lactamase family protein [Flavobacteriales bacterium]PIV94849.1 MAG: serine hydrolase [Flavobacteriaceae bacterium CG17_big_fil_post_rev_8_21_14_2_50_33_15]PIY10110.1 MAG: serine hydrolase [Flavobacteriaceae bacterium CG_4_10_14_3_um_filter_33_47]PJB18016.1 MAG: serine hydrolase [Flavobacteriaceae bacterium CG_4_9_14_3_um_filter_33_16]